MKTPTHILPLLGAWSALLLTTALAGAAEVTPDDLQWPWWRGPYSNGTAIATDQPLTAKPRLLWHSTEFTKRTSGSIAPGKLLGGSQSLVMHDDKVYCSYYIGSQDPVVFDAKWQKDEKKFVGKLQDMIDKGWIDGQPTNSGPLKRVGITELEVVQRMQCNIHGEDVMVCFDADTGETLWKTAVPGAVNNTGGSYGPHLTPAVDPTTGTVYAAGLNGRLIAFDGSTGEVLWTNTDFLYESGDLDAAIEAKRGITINHRQYEMNVAIDGVVVTSRRKEGTIGFDGATGKKLWQTGGGWHWLPWYHEDTAKWYLLFGGTLCVDPQTGEELWKLPREEARATAMDNHDLCLGVEGDRMFAYNACYRISPQGRELLWRNGDLFPKGNAPVIIDGVCYLSAADPRLAAAARETVGEAPPPESREYGRWRNKMTKVMKKDIGQGSWLVGVSMADGQLVSISAPTASGGGGGALLAAVGPLVYYDLKNDGSYLVFDTTAEDFGIPLPEGESKIGGRGHYLTLGNPYSVQTPACYKGRIYVRGDWSVACLDFTAAGADKTGGNK